MKLNYNDLAAIIQGISTLNESGLKSGITIKNYCYENTGKNNHYRSGNNFCSG